MARECIRFVLNGKIEELSGFAPETTLLSYLRLHKRLCGTKEGCAEGDCGACTVLVGKPKNGGFQYQSVNACICFLAMLDGCDVLTVEYLQNADGTLHPVQQAMVDEHGSQCGFCTPGFVMSLAGLWLSSEPTNEVTIERNLQGNLCRCTGYQPIVRAGLSSSKSNDNSSDLLERLAASSKLAAGIDAEEDVELRSKSNVPYFIPGSIDGLAKCVAEHPEATLVSGATDVGLWVNKNLFEFKSAIFLNRVKGLDEIQVHDERIEIGAGVSYTQLAPIIVEHFPQYGEVWNRIAGEQVRNLGTIGGNIANGSPIGDTPPLLIALGTTLNLNSVDGPRSIPLEEFFIQYGEQDLKPNEFVQSITIPRFKRERMLFAYKVSKRRHEDISSVCGAFSIEVNDGRIVDARIVFGGMAGTPKRASNTEAALIGLPCEARSAEAVLHLLDEDYQPLTDHRASKEYRSLVARNLLLRAFAEHQNGQSGSEIGAVA